MLIKIEKAKEIIFEKIHPLEIIEVNLNEADGFCLAKEIFADRDLPPTDRSAMDGFAVQAADIINCPKKLKLIGETAAGSAECPLVEQNTCVRILTGAVLPLGADAVVKVEDTKEKGNEVTIFEPAEIGLNIRKQGEEVRKGKVVIKSQKILNPAQIGICASVGKSKIKVFKKPKVAILNSGKELFPINANSEIKDYQIRDSNGPSLQAALRNSSLNLENSKLEVSPDAPEIIESKLRKLVSKNDVVILSGGVSVGKYDFVPEAIKKIGAEIQIHGILMKPGKPFLYATLGDNKQIFGLPGNPLSVLTGFYELVLPGLCKMSGYLKEDYSRKLFFPVCCDIKSKNYRTEFFLAKLVCIEGRTFIKPLNSNSSGDLISATEADGVFPVPTNTEIKKGEHVEFTFWK
ncbi:MAG: molybdopterin molybdotransferase MoeA [Alphaproteobacteria bacterium]